jgi:FkbM family methyltransferase
MTSNISLTRELKGGARRGAVSEFGTVNPMPVKAIQRLKRIVLSCLGAMALKTRVGERDFCVPPFDHIGKAIYERGSWEPGLTKFLTRNLRFEAPCLSIDVGANLGWYAAVFSSLLPVGSEVHAIEANPFTFGYLALNALNGGYVHFTPHLVAASNTNRRTRVSCNLAQLGWSQVSDDWGVQQTLAFPVDARPLDELLRDNRRPVGVIKADVEGHEIEMILGARELLQRTGVLVIEMTPALYGEDTWRLLDEAMLALSSFDRMVLLEGIYDDEASATPVPVTRLRELIEQRAPQFEMCLINTAICRSLECESSLLT